LSATSSLLVALAHNGGYGSRSHACANSPLHRVPHDRVIAALSAAAFTTITDRCCRSSIRAVATAAAISCPCLAQPRRTHSRRLRSFGTVLSRRLLSKKELLDELQEKTSIPGVLPTWLQPIQTRIVMLQTGIRAMMGVKVFGSDAKEIERIGLQMEQILKKVTGATDVIDVRIIGRPYIQYEIDREAIARYGVNVRDVQDIIEIAIGGENLTTTVEAANAIPCAFVTCVSSARTSTIWNASWCRPPPAPTCRLAKLAKISFTVGPQELKSENGLLVGYVTLNTRDRDEVSVVEDAEALLQSEKKRSDELIAAGRHEQATLVSRPAITGPGRANTRIRCVPRSGCHGWCRWCSSPCSS